MVAAASVYSHMVTGGKTKEANVKGGLDALRRLQGFGVYTGLGDAGQSRLDLNWGVNLCA